MAGETSDLSALPFADMDGADLVQVVDVSQTTGDAASGPGGTNKKATLTDLRTWAQVGVSGGGGSVNSVNGYTGPDVELDYADVGAAPLLGPTQTYNAVDWDGDLNYVTKDAFRDKMESVVISAGQAASVTPYVAANDASAWVKSGAFHTANGSADEVDINDITNLYGSVALSEGTFSIDSPIRGYRTGTTIKGTGTGRAVESSSSQSLGWGTVIIPTAGFDGSGGIVCQRADGHIQGSMVVQGLRIHGNSIAYRTLTDLDVASGTATGTTSAAHSYTVGQEIRIQGTGNTSIDDVRFTIATVPTTTTFTFATTAGNVTNLSGTVIQVVHGIDFKCFQSNISNVWVNGMSGDGYFIHGSDVGETDWDTYDTTVYNLLASRCKGAGLRAGRKGADLHGMQCIFLHNLGPGLHYTGGSSGQWTQIHCYSNFNGIRFESAGGTRTKITNCKIEHSERHGIYIDNSGGSTTAEVQISNTGFYNNGEETHNTYDHIHVGGGTSQATRWQLSNCKFGQSDTNGNLARYAINAKNYLTYMQLTGNDFGNTISSCGVATKRVNFETSSKNTLKATGNVGIADHVGSSLAAPEAI